MNMTVNISIRHKYKALSWLYMKLLKLMILLKRLKPEDAYNKALNHLSRCVSYKFDNGEWHSIEL